ncbi:hypothetical protein Q4566_16090 [Tamlana sp. 2_MG-2023]|uniref:nuclear transport factor 2 family protein n=1 Tax=unclassified Tamlana TaxID=2614803 RepID=UPI0026E348B7|nr:MULTISPECIES: hypothetical protein [unclassified Tamlana]MDO6761729.1 hypothetical protein [Tamlana sp. 2_MG-2023]MDO6792283.1 hypothetical protein [Tamlana sp. 1_MG-2023]
MTELTSQTQATIENFLKFLSIRNLNQITKLFSNEVDWFIPGDETKAPWLGKRSSRKEVEQFYDLLWSSTEPISAQISNILIDHENAVITGEFSTKMLQTGKIVSSLFCIVMIVENNLITKYRLLEDSYAVSKALSQQ